MIRNHYRNAPKKAVRPQPQSVRPTALIFHPAGDNVLVTKHEIYNEKLTEGVLVDNTDVSRFTLSLIGHHSSANNAILSPNTLTDNIDTLMWYKPAHKGLIWFTSGGMPVRSFQVTYPTLLFKASKKSGRLRVFALATSTRPTINTAVYLAPLMNINAGGLLCFGSANVPNVIDSGSMNDFEAALLDSNFSHTNYQKNEDGFSHASIRFTKRQSHYYDDKAHVSFWREKESSGLRVYANEMQRFGTLADVINL